MRRRGSFIIFANRYLKKGVPHEEIVRRNTSLVADHFGIEKRGRLQEGNFADIAVIDLDHYYDLGMRLCDIAHQDFLVHAKTVDDIFAARKAGSTSSTAWASASWV